MPDKPPRDQVLDFAGPAEESLFWEAKSWLIAKRTPELQKELDATWEHYKSIDDQRLLALVGALCVESAIDSLLVAVAPGFGECLEDTAFTFAIKIRIARAFKGLPTRVLTSCDLVRQMRNAFAHNLDVKSFADLDAKYLAKLPAQVESFNPANRPPTDYATQFKDLVGMLIGGLWIYTEQLRRLREFTESPAGRDAFKTWAASK